MLRRNFSIPALLSLASVLMTAMPSVGYADEENNESQTDPQKEDKEDGDPVALFTGSFHLEETDLTLPGRSLDLEITRTYQSRTSIDTPMGKKWDLNWYSKIVVYYSEFDGGWPGPGDTVQDPEPGDNQQGGQHSGGEGSGGGGDSGETVQPVLVVDAVEYFDGFGRRDYLTEGENSNEWDLPRGHFAKVRGYDDDPTEPGYHPEGFMVRRPDGTIHRYEAWEYDSFYAPGQHVKTYWLSSVTDRFGNTLTASHTYISWSQGSTLAIEWIDDTYDRRTSFNYAADLRLDSIIDPEGRTTLYGHSGSNLESVTTPATTEFPTGRTTQYDYATDNNLLSIAAPNEVADNPTNPTPYVVNTYNADGNRVIAQDFGGINVTGVEAGGRYLFIPQPIFLSWPWFQEGGRVLRVTPNGNITLTIFDDRGFDILTYDFTGRFDPKHPAFSNLDSVAVADLVDVNVWTLQDALNSATAILDPEPEYLPAYIPPLRANEPNCYITYKTFTQDGQLKRIHYPDAASQTTYDIEYTYDEQSPDAFQRGNLLRETRYPRDNSEAINFVYAYEPLFNQLRATVDPRGLSASFTPPNGGSNSVARYLTKMVFDFQEESIDTGTLQGVIDTWDIDLIQDSQYIAVPELDGVLPRILADDGLPDVNNDPHSSGVWQCHPRTKTRSTGIGRRFSSQLESGVCVTGCRNHHILQQLWPSTIQVG